MRRVLRYVAWGLAGIFVIALGAHFWAHQVATKRYDTQWTVHKDEFPMPVPLREDELAWLRAERIAAGASADAPPQVWTSTPRRSNAQSSTAYATRTSSTDPKALMAFAIDHDKPHAAEPPPEAPNVEFGAHIVQVCRGCHNPKLTGGKLQGDPDMPIVANLTPHETGLKGWHEADFVRALREASATMEPRSAR